MQYYQLTMPAKVGSLTVVMDSAGKCYVFQRKPNGKMIPWDEGRASFYGPNGFLKSTGLPGAITLVRLALGRHFINNAPRLSLVFTLIARCFGVTIQTWHA